MDGIPLISSGKFRKLKITTEVLNEILLKQIVQTVLLTRQRLDVEIYCAEMTTTMIGSQVCIPFLVEQICGSIQKLKDVYSVSLRCSNSQSRF